MKNLILSIILILTLIGCNKSTSYEIKTQTDKNGFSYETVTNDPLNTRIYTLKNGLKVYLSVNKNEPRIQGLIAVRAGSKNDPKETTGLAHYLEHLMFKGTSKIGTLDWSKEEPLLQQISDLYEKHRQTTDSIAKKNIYAKIDSVSQLASKFAISNEYDKMSAIIGANGTNAFTSNEQTVYINNIPSNEVERWMMLESERFSNLVLRLFHTELETVYEEFNMSQDDDNDKAYDALMLGLYPNHPYGTQTTIGKAEHLKNPSMINIHKFWSTYYVPNNMAICMSGDLNPEETIQLIDKYWGKFQPNKNVPEFAFTKEEPIKEPIIKKIYGPDVEFLNLGYRFNNAKSEDVKYVQLISEILNNSQAGLIDLDLVQKQKVLSADCYTDFMNDYGYFVINATPREGQKLSEVKDLLLQEIEKIKKGEFDNWLLEAIINNMRLKRIQSFEENWRAFNYVQAFICNENWADKLKEIDNMEKITKQQIVDFAKANFNNNYVIVYKHTGEDKTAIHINKPKITPVELNRIDESAFMKNYKTIQSKAIEPVFVDFNKQIQKDVVCKNIPFSYIKNDVNELSYLDYIIDMGKNHDKMLALAIQYLPYLGTTKYSPEDLKKEFFKLGMKMGVSTDAERSYVYISGLDKTLEKGIELLEHVLLNSKPDQKAYNDFIAGILKERSNNKLNKDIILWNALYSYAKFGSRSEFTNIFSEKDLKNIKPQELIDLLKKLLTYKHQIFYYGPREIKEVKALVTKLHITPTILLNYPTPVIYPELEINKPVVYFLDYDMVQSDILLIAKDELLNLSLLPALQLYNEFYGSGMSSIVFQEIREAKGLAYSSYSFYTIPNKPTKSHYIVSFVGTQPDKINDALSAMQKLMNQMPEAPQQFDASKKAILGQIASERIIKDNIFWTYLSSKDMGLNHDYRKETYEQVKKMNINDVKNFFNNHIKGKNFAILVIGKKDKIDKKILSKFGEVKELTLEQVFNY